MVNIGVAPATATVYWDDPAGLILSLPYTVSSNEIGLSEKLIFNGYSSILDPQCLDCVHDIRRSGWTFPPADI